MKEKKESGKSIVKTFRIDINLADKIEVLREARDTTMRTIITDALVSYLSEHLDKARLTMEEIAKVKEEADLKEHMYIPIEYYAMSNDLTVQEVNKKISKRELRSVTLGSVKLVMIEVNEAAYKKAELLMIRNNVSKTQKEITALRAELNKLKREIKNEKEDDTL